LFLIQVAEDQKLLRERIQHLGGEAGIGRMESALFETRSKFFQAKENRWSVATTFAKVASPSVTILQDSLMFLKLGRIVTWMPKRQAELSNLCLELPLQDMKVAKEAS